MRVAGSLGEKLNSCEILCASDHSVKGSQCDFFCMNSSNQKDVFREQYSEDVTMIISQNRMNNNSPGARCLFLKICCTPCEKVIFAFKRSYIISEVIKSMFDIPVPGYFRNLGY